MLTSPVHDACSAGQAIQVLAVFIIYNDGHGDDYNGTSSEHQMMYDCLKALLCVCVCVTSLCALILYS